MTPASLLYAVVGFLRSTVDGYAAAIGKNGEPTPIHVYDWCLPFKNPKLQDDPDFPYIVVAISDGVDADAESVAYIDLYFGVYSKAAEIGGYTQADGAYDLLNLMEHVRIALFRQAILANRYRIKKPYKWEIPREQPYPLWCGTAKSIWTVQSVTSQEMEEFLHGQK